MLEIINEVVSWLNNNGPATTAIATVVLAIITGFYLIETRKQNSITVRPYPKLRLIPENTKDGRFLFLYVENIGRGPLIDIITKVIDSKEESFSRKIVLAVGEKTRIKLGEEEKYQKYKELKINIIYTDIYDKEYQKDFDLETHINDTSIMEMGQHYKQIGGE